MDTPELLARAAHYRDLAARITDAETRQGLLELAENYEVLTRQTQADSEPRSPPATAA